MPRTVGAGFQGKCFVGVRGGDDVSAQITAVLYLTLTADWHGIPMDDDVNERLAANFTVLHNSLSGLLSGPALAVLDALTPVITQVLATEWPRDHVVPPVIPETQFDQFYSAYWTAAIDWYFRHFIEQLQNSLSYAGFGTAMYLFSFFMYIGQQQTPTVEMNLENLPRLLEGYHNNTIQLDDLVDFVMGEGCLTLWVPLPDDISEGEGDNASTTDMEGAADSSDSEDDDVATPVAYDMDDNISDSEEDDDSVIDSEEEVIFFD